MDQPQRVTVDSVVKAELDGLAVKIEQLLEADVVAVFGPILPGFDYTVRLALEAFDARRSKLAIVLETGGGVVEVVERIVNTIRNYYGEVAFVVPDRALSAGTVLVMSGDAILMDYFACLGPIDPQIQREGRLVPALSYLVQYQRLIEKSRAGELTTAEFALLNKFDLAELHQYEEARELSIELLTRWLANYKFRNWTKTESTGKDVSAELRHQRAREIADKLSDNQIWHSHGRGIPMRTLRDELKLRIDDFDQNALLGAHIRAYHSLVREYMLRSNFPNFVHTRCFF